jgi:DNA-binding response OmpR family regulator
MSILIVEDNQVALRIIETALQKQNYQTVSARTGKQALEQLVLQDNIELVITDILMPEIDGLNLIKLMKQNDEYKDIPVIVSTSVADLETVKKVGMMGVKHYIVKPIEKHQLIKKVQEVLHQQKPKVVEEKELEDTQKVVNKKTAEDDFDFDLDDDLDVVEPEKKVTVTEKEKPGTNEVSVQEVLDLLASAAPLGSAKVINTLHVLVSNSENLDKKIISDLQKKIDNELKEKMGKGLL